MVGERIGVKVGIDVGRIGHIKAVFLGPAQHRILVPKEVARAIAIAGIERTVKRHFGRVRIRIYGAIGVVIVETGAAVRVIGFVRGNAGLEDEVLVSTIVAYVEEDEALIA